MQDGRVRVPVWRTVGTAFRLTAACVRRLPIASAIAVVAEFLIVAFAYQRPDLAITVIVHGGHALLLAPYAVLMHRSIILGEVRDAYWGEVDTRRSLRFAAHLFALTILFDLLEHVPNMLASPAATTLHAILLPSLCIIPAAAIFAGSLLTFPAIATEESATPVRDSFGLAWGSLLRIAAAGAVIELPTLLLYPLIVFGLELVDLPSNRLSAGALVVLALLRAFTFASLVTLASQLYKTRNDWTFAPKTHSG